MIRTLTLITTILLLAVSANAQHQADNWYFGNFAGAKFTLGGILPVSSSVLSTDEGCSSISDENGQLLFYTDGMNVYNRLDQPMPNGNGLKGDFSSAQSAIIVQKPGNPNLYYIFTVDNEAGTDGINYSVVDITLSGGYGNVTAEKNIPLTSGACEMMTAVQHSNLEDVWLVTREWNSSSIKAFLITSAGVETTPVVSSSLQNLNGPVERAIGLMKISPDGNKIALSYTKSGVVEVKDFDASNGQASGGFLLSNFTDGPYGIEFSPSGSKLYVAEEGFNLWQFNLDNFSQATVTQSQFLVHFSYEMFGQLQLGPDKAIYIARVQQARLSAVEHPDNKGHACTFIDTAVILSNNGELGLPGFMTSLFNAGYTATPTCFGDSTYFIPNISGIDSILWEIYDLGSPFTFFSNDIAPVLLFKNPGNYEVILTVWKGGVSKSHFSIINIEKVEKPAWLQDTSICFGDSVVLEFADPDIHGLWQSSIVSKNYISYTEETVNLTYWKNACFRSDSMRIFIYDKPVVALRPDTTICPQEHFVLKPQFSDSIQFFWEDGTQDTARALTNSGLYILNYTDGAYCAFSDSFELFYKQIPLPNLPTDTSLCRNTTWTIDFNLPGAMINWQDGATNDNYLIYRSGMYSYEVDYDGCTVTDTVRVKYTDCDCKIFMPNAFTPDFDGLNDELRSIIGCSVVDYEMVIYNRIGQLVFQTRQYDQGWDGEYKSAPAPSATYYYIINAKVRDDSGKLASLSANGSVQLLR